MEAIESKNEIDKKEDTNKTELTTINPIVINGIPPIPMMSGISGFTPYPMFGPHSMLPFIPNNNNNVENDNNNNNNNKTKIGKQCGDWQSYITEKGKTYYFNIITKITTWNKPNEWIDKNNKINKNKKEEIIITENNNKESYLGTKATKELSLISDTIAKRSFGNKLLIKYKDRNERINAFRELLSSKQIECDWNWKKVLPKIVNDKRYNALTKLQDKKNELIKWQQDEKKRIKEEEKIKRDKLKNNYFKLLNENIDKIIRKEFRKAKHYLESDIRYELIKKINREEKWFDEWQKKEYKEYKKKKKKIKRNCNKTI